MKIGSNIAALAVVAEINRDRTILITIKLRIIDEAFFPNLKMNQRANLFATPVVTSILASTNERIFSHITLCPSCAYATSSGNTPVSTNAMINIKEVR